MGGNQIRTQQHCSSAPHPSLPTFSQSPAGLYLHIPFCVRKCGYCDFYSSRELAALPAFLVSLEQEIRMRAAPEQRFDTLYVGGGTPSLVTPAALSQLINRLWQCYGFESDVEVTLEANPGTVTLESLRAWRAAGVNRIQLGIQSFRDDHLRFLGRIHSAVQARDCLTLVRQAGFDNVGLDLIYGLPDQQPRAWIQELETALDYAPEHLACYLLTYESGTPLERAWRRGEATRLSDAYAAPLFETTNCYLTARGYHWYEIANFARTPQFCSRHNRKYWNHVPYLGFGPSAHSYESFRRYWNRRDLAGYMAALKAEELPIADEEWISGEQRVIESLYLGLRQREGIGFHHFKQCCGMDFMVLFGELVAEMVTEGLMRIHAGRCRLTSRGALFLDSVVGRLVNAIPE